MSMPRWRAPSSTLLHVRPSPRVVSPCMSSLSPHTSSLRPHARPSLCWSPSSSQPTESSLPSPWEPWPSPCALPVIVPWPTPRTPSSSGSSSSKSSPMERAPPSLSPCASSSSSLPTESSRSSSCTPPWPSPRGSSPWLPRGSQSSLRRTRLPPPRSFSCSSVSSSSLQT
ncbi:hypothetical protein BRADI_3g18546v3 [Brachypodium distachyon]|uniref:Uncharacterized protein n=1 Tax=Brachypodium distachyon TaxID=15368 RepID=A0A0Q3F8G5_BRADI|nr:hypothetical protein BRADI_3g18546v3 [Brachypodium distachyon]